MNTENARFITLLSLLTISAQTQSFPSLAAFGKYLPRKRTFVAGTAGAACLYKLYCDHKNHKNNVILNKKADLILLLVKPNRLCTYEELVKKSQVISMVNDIAPYREFDLTVEKPDLDAKVSRQWIKLFLPDIAIRLDQDQQERVKTEIIQKLHDITKRDRVKLARVIVKKIEAMNLQTFSNHFIPAELPKEKVEAYRDKSVSNLKLAIVVYNKGLIYILPGLEDLLSLFCVADFNFPHQ